MDTWILFCTDSRLPIHDYTDGWHQCGFKCCIYMARTVSWVLHTNFGSLRILDVNSLSDEQVESLLLSFTLIYIYYNIYIYTQYMYEYIKVVPFNKQKVLFKLTVPWDCSSPIFSRNKLILVPQAGYDFKVLWIFAEISIFSMLRRCHWHELILYRTFNTELI